MMHAIIRLSLSAAALVAAVSTSAFAGPLPLFPFDPAPYQAPRTAAYAPVETEAAPAPEPAATETEPAAAEAPAEAKPRRFGWWNRRG